MIQLPDTGPWKRIERIGNAVLLLGDCLEILPTLPKVDAVITDPPYGVGKNYGKHDDKSLLSLEWLEICRQLAPVMVTPGYVNTFSYPKPDAVLIRFDKTAQSPCAIAWMNKWEPVFVYGKLPRRFAWDVIQTATQVEKLSEPPIDHPCPKSIHLMRKLVEQVDGAVLDPFAGSGTTGVACANLGRSFIGIEIEPKYFDIACERIENAQRQTRMFA
jgi:site-specific DNA-methyltransferase (adenine-specific)